MSTNTTITARQYFQNVLDAHLSDKMDELSAKYIAGLDARNEKRKSADSKEKREVAARREVVFGCLSDVPIFADTIAANTDLTVGQVRSALTALVKDGKASKVSIKVDKSVKMAYTLPIEE